MFSTDENGKDILFSIAPVPIPTPAPANPMVAKPAPIYLAACNNIKYFLSIFTLYEHTRQPIFIFIFFLAC